MREAVQNLIIKEREFLIQREKKKLLEASLEETCIYVYIERDNLLLHAL